MSHLIPISDEAYSTIVTLANERGQTPEDLTAQLLQQQLDLEWEAICAKYDDLTSSPEWDVMEREADDAHAAGRFTRYMNEEDLNAAFEEHGKHANI